MSETAQPITSASSPVQPRLVSEEQLEIYRGRIADRGIDPRQILGRNELGNEISVAGFYAMLGSISATEKAGQDPTFFAARLALHADLPSEIADTLFLAYNQQSAEEAGHGDKVFGNAFYALGGYAPASDLSAVGGVAANTSAANTGAAAFLQPTDDRKRNRRVLTGFAAILGGIETVALHRVFPLVVSLCEAWDHPIAHDLLNQIRDTVRPEESRHVLIWRYIFHKLMAPKGNDVVEIYFQGTNGGRRQLGSPDLDRESFMRLIGTSAPTPKQLIGKERSALI